MDDWINDFCAFVRGGDLAAARAMVEKASTEAQLTRLERVMREDGWSARFDLAAIMETLRARRGVLAREPVAARSHLPAHPRRT